ncbi:MAG: hypothetical protein NTW12_13795 [Deltaproteobacteria bacterium]|nr:hypothetical protein [Deltaproteobacteria bacterium]
MLDLDGIKIVFDKLKDKDEPGELECIEGGRKEKRYSYYYKGKAIFTFGLTRSSSAKSKRFNYIPEQMCLLRSEYRKMHDCSWYKKQYNEKIDSMAK